MTPHYLTYFDSNYAARGIAMLRSLRRVSPNAAISVHCLDERVREILAAELDGAVTTLAPDHLLRGSETLRALQRERTPWEFYATQKPLLIRTVLASTEPGACVVYIDADTWWFSSPEKTLARLEDASVVITPHRFNEHTAFGLRYGRFNAGFGLWRHDERGLACLDHWFRDCCDWCFQELDGERFMNQGYMNRWPDRYECVHVLAHPGFNLAPWNVGTHRVRRGLFRVRVDREPLVFFHFSGTIRTAAGCWETFYDNPGMRQAVVRRHVYRPYLAEVEAIAAGLEARHGVDGLGTARTAFPAGPRLRLA